MPHGSGGGRGSSRGRCVAWLTVALTIAVLALLPHATEAGMASNWFRDKVLTHADA
jgi:hypothetical protein